MINPSTARTLTNFVVCSLRTWCGFILNTSVFRRILTDFWISINRNTIKRRRSTHGTMWVKKPSDTKNSLAKIPFPKVYKSETVRPYWIKVSVVVTKSHLQNDQFDRRLMIHRTQVWVSKVPFPESDLWNNAWVTWRSWWQIGGKWVTSQIPGQRTFGIDCLAGCGAREHGWEPGSLWGRWRDAECYHGETGWYGRSKCEVSRRGRHWKDGWVGDSEETHHVIESSRTDSNFSFRVIIMEYSSARHIPMRKI